jgi:4-amino-4-deoxy-L-arabinose transferase-like glycosyltransferase
LGSALKGFGVAFLVGLAIVALWLVPAITTGDAAFREELLWHQTAGRVAGGLAHDRPVWFLAALLPVLLFPWGCSWRTWRGMAGSWGDPAARLCVIWAVSGLVLFSLISGKQAHYLIPEFPAVALLFARALGRVRPGRGGSLAVLALAGFGAAAIVLYLQAGPGLNRIGDLLADWSIPLMGSICIALALLAFFLPTRIAHLVAGLGLAAALHLPVLLAELGASYDGTEIAQRLAAAEPGGLAQIGLPQNAQFTFQGRLTTRIATLEAREELDAWVAEHPDGTVFGDLRWRDVLARPDDVMPYYLGGIGFWSAEAFTSRE